MANINLQMELEKYTAKLQNVEYDMELKIIKINYFHNIAK